MLLGIDSMLVRHRTKEEASKEGSSTTRFLCNTFVTAATTTQLLFLDARWSFLLINLIYALIVCG